MEIGLLITATEGRKFKTEKIVSDDTLLAFIIYEDSDSKFSGSYYLSVFDIISIEPCILTK